MQSKEYEYRVTALGLSRFSNLEGFGSQLQECLDTEATQNAREGWELWQFDTLNDHQGNNGLILVYRQLKSNP
jgi:hypothetical protein